MAPRCCTVKGIRIITVGSSKAGVIGLEQVLEETLRRGCLPDQKGLKEDLVTAVRAQGNYVAPSSEEAYGDALAAAYRDYFKQVSRNRPAHAAHQQGGRMKIEILGPGCARCRATEETVRKALAELKLEAEVSHVTDPVEIGRRGVMLTPGVVLDGQVRSSGRVPSLEDVKSWLTPRAA